MSLYFCWVLGWSYYFLFGDLFRHILLTAGNVIVGDNNEIMDRTNKCFFCWLNDMEKCENSRDIIG